MLYKERLQKLVESGDPFWIDAIDRFIEATYENKEQGISDLEELAKDRTRFNEFTKQIIQRKDDLKSVKAEFLENIKNNYIKNINSISEKVVEKIQKLDDNAVVSMATLLDGNKYDSKTMFDIYNITVKKLEEVGLYLDFEQYDNAFVGLPLYIPFKKGYIKHIIISERFYNGHYGKGSIFSKIFDFTLNRDKAVIKTYLEFCIDTKIKDRATLESSIPFIMSEEEILKINEILDNIKSNYQVYDKKEKTFSPEYFQYTDVNIDGVNYALKSGIISGIVSYDDNLSKLRELIRCAYAEKAISSAYDYLTK